MTDLLIKRFAKDENRARLGTLAGITGIACNLLLAVLKLITGLLTGSVAISADAVNNFSDSASSIAALLGFRLAQRPADKNHPFGHARYEYLAALAVSAMILVLGVELIKTSVHKIFSPEPVETGLGVYLVLLASIGLKLWMAGFYRKIGIKIDSQTLLAAAQDSRNDVLTTGAVLVSILIQAATRWNVDGWIGLSVALFILWSGFQSLRDTISPLLGKQDDTLAQNITQLVLSHPAVLGVHDLLIHDYGPGQRFASLHAEVSADTNTLDVHELLDDIEDDAMRQMNVHLVIHCDPIVTDDPEWKAQQRTIQNCAASLSSSLSVHDLHRMHQDGQLRIGFDLAVPFDAEGDPTEWKIKLEAAIREAGIHCPLEIQLDRE